MSGTLPGNPWNPVRPRALVEPWLEAWAAAHLGDSSTVVVAETAARRVLLSEAGLCALDLVYASDLVALERTLRAVIPDLGQAVLAVTREAGWPAGTRALGQVVGLASTLRSLISGSRPLLPADLARPGDAPSRDLAAALPEVGSRVAALAGALGATVSAMSAAVAAIPEDGIFADQADADAAATAILALESFGIPMEPNDALPLDVSWVRRAWEAAEARALSAQGCVDRLASLPPSTPPELVLEATQDVVDAVFGEGFLVVPVLVPGATPDGFVDAVALPAFAQPQSSAVRRFVRDVGTVRPQVTRLSETLLLGGALGAPGSVSVVQLTERGPDGPAAGTTHWLAGPLPVDGPWPAAPAAHIVLDLVGTIDDQSAVAGLALDGWVEHLPAQVGPKADPDDPRPGSVTTGLAIRSNSASARPPQAVLCAVSPDGKRWTTDSLRGVVEATLELAKARLVTLERLQGEGLHLPALYVRSSSLQGELFMDFSKLAELRSAFVSMPYVKER
jgi:hypothetical protein